MIVNANEFKTTFINLGWNDLSPTEVEDWMNKAGIDPAGVLALLKALVASPNGLDERQVAGGPAPDQLPYVIEYFKGKKVIV